MGDKGQIFTLDFVISMVLVILAFGLVLNFMELNEYNLHGQEIRAELGAVGGAAADIMVTSPSIVCELGYYEKDVWHRISYLPNCIMKQYHSATTPTPHELKINKTILGLDVQDAQGNEMYGCLITTDPTVPVGVYSLEKICDDDPGKAKIIYSVKRSIIVPDAIHPLSTASVDELPYIYRRLEKKYFEDFKNTQPVEVTLQVWRNE